MITPLNQNIYINYMDASPVNINGCNEIFNIRNQSSASELQSGFARNIDIIHLSVGDTSTKTLMLILVISFSISAFGVSVSVVFSKMINNCNAV